MLCENRTLLTPKKIEIDVNVVVSAITASVAIFANFMIVIIFISHAKLRSLSNAAITLLCFTDLLRATIVMPLKIQNQLHYSGSDQVVLGEPICTLTALTSGFTSVFCSLMLVLIAVIQYSTINRWKYGKDQLTKTTFSVSVICLLLIATVFSTLPMSGIGVYRYSPAHGVCFADWCDDNRTFRFIFFVLIVVIAWPILTFSYGALYITFRRFCKDVELAAEIKASCEKLPQNKCSSEKDTLSSFCDDETTNTMKEYSETLLEDYIPQVGVPKHEFISNKIMHHEGYVAIPSDPPANRLSKEEKRITILILLMFIAYCVCWFPASAVNIIAIFDIKVLPAEWFYITVTIVDIKCAVNPILYGLGNRRFWNAFKSIFCLNTASTEVL